jgi:hypothetical protein
MRKSGFMDGVGRIALGTAAENRNRHPCGPGTSTRAGAVGAGVHAALAGRVAKTGPHTPLEPGECRM